MRTLILVDIQKDFLPGGALAVPRGNEVVPVANRLQPGFKLVVCDPRLASPPVTGASPPPTPGRSQESSPSWPAFRRSSGPTTACKGRPAPRRSRPGDEPRRDESFRKGDRSPRIDSLQRVLRQRAPQIDRPGRLPEGTRGDGDLRARPRHRLLREVHPHWMRVGSAFVRS